MPQLSQRLGECSHTFAGRFAFDFVLVDDGSTDDTRLQLEAAFHGQSGVRVVQHGTNLGIAAAIMTGLRASRSEAVVSMDSDCTYDPRTMDQLLDRLTDEVDLVTASPYHPAGRVVGVPAWRLWLSRQASKCYQRALGLELHTFTSCFRAYRRSFFVDMELQNPGFVGIAEMLCLTVSRGGRVVEVPAELTTRKAGFSKLKTLPVIRGHLSLLKNVRDNARMSQPATKCRNG